mmetsp:Transcript_19072/g.44950  ORF Transcript_19072/g.44950 Transcript_19072/m.44950 type:complete len:221 (+) Transcript_19072:1255-1917(+)
MPQLLLLLLRRHLQQARVSSEPGTACPLRTRVASRLQGNARKLRCNILCAPPVRSLRTCSVRPVRTRLCSSLTRPRERSQPLLLLQRLRRGQRRLLLLRLLSCVRLRRLRRAAWWWPLPLLLRLLPLSLQLMCARLLLRRPLPLPRWLRRVQPRQRQRLGLELVHEIGLVDRRRRGEEIVEINVGRGREQVIKQTVEAGELVGVVGGGGGWVVGVESGDV